MKKQKSQKLSDDLVIFATVKAGRTQEKVVVDEAQNLVIAVHAQREKGKANEAVCELLADTLKVAKSSIEIVSGHTAPRKKIKICNYTMEELTQLLGEKK